MKKALTLLLVCLLAFSFVGCYQTNLEKVIGVLQTYGYDDIEIYATDIEDLADEFEDQFHAELNGLEFMLIADRGSNHEILILYFEEKKDAEAAYEDFNFTLKVLSKALSDDTIDYICEYEKNVVFIGDKYSVRLMEKSLFDF